MSSFQAKIGRKRMRKGENKNYHYVSFLPDAKFKNSNKIAKKFKKLKNTTMASFKSKIGRKMSGTREYKKYRSVLFLPDAKQKISKK